MYINKLIEFDLHFHCCSVCGKHVTFSDMQKVYRTTCEWDDLLKDNNTCFVDRNTGEKIVNKNRLCPLCYRIKYACL